MEITNNAKATIVFTAVLGVLAVYDMASGMANPDWGATRPDFIKDASPFDATVARPRGMLPRAAARGTILSGLRDPRRHDETHGEH